MPWLYKGGARAVRAERRRSRGRDRFPVSRAMPGLWERLAGGERGRLETSDCESLGSASGSEGGECGSLRGWRMDEGPWAEGWWCCAEPLSHPQNPGSVSPRTMGAPAHPCSTPKIGVSHTHGTPSADLSVSPPQMPSTPRGCPCRTWTWSCCTTPRTSCCAPT